MCSNIELTGSYSSCKVGWRTAKKAGYKEVIEENMFIKQNAKMLRHVHNYIVGN